MKTRREVLALSLALMGAAASSCLRRRDYDEEDEAELAAQQSTEREHSGKGPYGDLQFLGYRELAKLPYFELNEKGRLVLTVKDLPKGIDFHTHLGMNLLFAPNIDLQKATKRIAYLLDCDREDPGCDFDLDVYINSAFDEELHAELSGELRSQLFLGSDAAATHTIPNLVAELDEVGFEQAATLPIAAGLPFGDDLADRWLSAIESSDFGDRLIPFASVHPNDKNAIKLLRQFAERGVRGVKFHPEMQRFYPDDPRAMALYQECGDLGLPIIFHAGRSGIEPKWMRSYPMIQHFEEPALRFPKVQFLLGHAGARDVDEAIKLARKHSNIWLEITGQGVTKLDEILREVGSERILFGSDWPFYPLAATLAKVLLVTEKDADARAAILRNNGLRLLEIAKSIKSRPWKQIFG